MTKRLLSLICALVLSIFCTFAQEMSVRSMSHRERDLSARSHVRNDLNGEPCALVRVEFPLEEVVFDGNIVGDIERHVNEYWVYLTAGSKWLEIRHPKLYTLEVLFSDYAIPSLEGLQTYKLVVSVPLVVALETKEIIERPLPAKEEKNVIAKEKSKKEKGNKENVHEYVDLGLPSGLLWATCNVGASSPEDHGDSFGWGETTTKNSYDWSNYKYSKKSSTTLTKYNNSSSYGIVDNKTVLDPEDDVAHINWGGGWRMPTRKEMNELRDTNNCTWTWTMIRNGKYGYKVTSKKNGNFLFLPAAFHGTIWDNAEPPCKGRIMYYGLYWLSSIDTSNPNNAYSLCFDSSSVDGDSNSRCSGHSVRPVCSSSE